MALFVADTEGLATIRDMNLKTGLVQSILGTGARRGAEGNPLRCALARPHAMLVGARGVLCVADSEAHRHPEPQPACCETRSTLA